LLFTHTLREIVHHLKYADRVSLANQLGDILSECPGVSPSRATSSFRFLFTDRANGSGVLIKPN